MKNENKCTKPNCDCAEKEMIKQGTEFIKSYPCLVQSTVSELEKVQTAGEKLKAISKTDSKWIEKAKAKFPFPESKEVESVPVIADKSLFEKLYGWPESDFNFTSPLLFAKSLSQKVKMKDDEIGILAETIEMFLRGSQFKTPPKKENVSVKSAEEILDSTAANFGKNNFFNMAWDCEKPEEIEACALNAMETYASQFKTNPIEVIKNRIKELEGFKIGESTFIKNICSNKISELNHILKLIQ